MAITADRDGKNYVLGRGEVLFDRFAANVEVDSTTVGDGYRYIGNTPEVSITSSAEDLDHFDSDSGVKVKDDSVQLTMDRSGKFNTDNIDIGNLALLFLGEAGTVSQSAVADIDEVITLKRGFTYQIGQSASNPTGVRAIDNLVIGKGVSYATDVPAATNWEVDEDLALLYVLPDAPGIDAAGTEVQLTYDTTAVEREQVISASQSIYGQIKFIAKNPKGKNRDVYCPYVKISPDGDFSLKGDDWQNIGFTFEVLKRGNLEAVYVDGRAA
jgi:hypothetical protein